MSYTADTGTVYSTYHFRSHLLFMRQEALEQIYDTRNTVTYYDMKTSRFILESGSGVD